MKASVKQYARSLFELVADKSEAEAKKIIAQFIDFVQRRQDLNKADAIIAELERMYDEASGEARAQLISARPLNESVKLKIATYLEKRTGVKKIILNEENDSSLIGGFILRFNGLVIDGSVKNNLRKFKKQLSN